MRMQNTGRLLSFTTLLLLAGLASAEFVFDVERAFRNFDRMANGEIGASDLSEKERAAVMLIQNTFDQMERDVPGALDWVDCPAARTLARQQASQVTFMSQRLMSCADRNDLQALRGAASGMSGCARAGGFVDHCNANRMNIERLRSGSAVCISEIRSTLREQRHLAAFRTREAAQCIAPPPLLQNP